MDRMLAIIIIFLGAMILTAAILAMGAVPQIFKTAKELDVTQSIINQTELRLQEEEDRSKHTNILINQVSTIVEDHHDKLQDYIIRSNNTTEKILNDILALQLKQEEAEKQRDVMQKGIKDSQDRGKKTLDGINNITKHIEEITDDILNVTEEDHKGAEKNREIVRNTYDLVKDINDTLSIIR